MGADPNISYIRIRPNSLHPLLPVPFDLFIHVADHYIQYLRAGDYLTNDKILKFDAKAAAHFHIRDSDKKKYKAYIEGILKSDQYDGAVKALVLKESAFALVEELFEAANIKQALADSKEVIKSFMEMMEQESDAMANLLGLSSHDFYTYNHSLDVCIYSLGLGQIAGLKGQELFDLGQGALFHDIGKRQIDIKIITKDGPLNEQEWVEMKKHPLYGLKILTEHKVEDSIKASCLEHHESRQGNGYPQGLSGEEIHPNARIVAICDTYDALTTKRSYNEPMSPTDALNFMKDKLSGKFDEEMMKAMYYCLFKMNSDKKAG